MKFALKIIFIFLIFVAILILLAPAKQKLSYGVTFSQKFSEEFGFESANGMAGWKRNYLALLDDLKVKDLRLVAYWDLVEPAESQFNFKDLDWQITEAEKRGAKIILVVGRKVPRWPECHIPSWARFSTPPGKKSDFFGVSKSDFEEGGVFQRAQLLNYIKTTIEHYRSNPAIIAWQVENEPLFPFGECGTIPVSLLNQEIKLVKSLSNKPVILTDSGELGFAWPYLAAKSDIFGTTLYRYINNRFLGDIRYSLIPAYYFRIKARWAGKILGKQIIISELQAEPWSQVSLAETSFDDQAKSMSPEKFREIIDYAERSGFPKAYLWGAEWWYWMKEKQGRPEMWEAARSAINNPPAGRAGF
ncbi:hypothetical protein A3G55_03660 [Candidatus Giovannonibacteria bacterium RIFCSPLOWO2_12_FULL_44_25]|uniref:Glycoside hydrolase family 42 N-terminal domain-containing protein n=2 Tax=Candidatus Giovannoniibacteriota TaxID=1752738 RepID=A0A1F5WBR8_9BACT|nr:MAG: hypothetical protein UW53_C0030G0006 [Candidatus Giovannonibacteria bacterium GW2011_GWA1_44_25]KKT90670.1 MAG: hypothetical protein UW93_C0025G0006 [Parcubacteria group bacterium GW2011_GWC1_45_13]KKU28767.1 MAG: hypothetical protein UX43_C0021G0006 [Candidatus Giovannonibacteria bacterium GW2011_GWB1_46_20]OGF60154.1 MAG: hypothetical protein A2W40_01000 [Candidatus Giovannonibacteria bacterium RIFCSPHIGHO2_01_45_12]OGF60244.1 MAG: hypothetical protein A2656_02785 [Candidatus Giovanno